VKKKRKEVDLKIGNLILIAVIAGLDVKLVNVNPFSSGRCGLPSSATPYASVYEFGINCPFSICTISNMSTIYNFNKPYSTYILKQGPGEH
jgi:hypothetical protein